jgi:hypothetical protein
MEVPRLRAARATARAISDLPEAVGPTRATATVSRR